MEAMLYNISKKIFVVVKAIRKEGTDNSRGHFKVSLSEVDELKLKLWTSVSLPNSLSFLLIHKYSPT